MNIKHLLEQHSERLVTIMVFAIAFSVIGYYVPRTYFEFFDARDYVEIRQPVSPEFPTYNRGEKIGLIINRRSFINTEVIQTGKIVHVNGALQTKQLDERYYSKKIAIENTKGQWVVIKTDGVRIPCDAAAGSNFIQFVFQYPVNGIPKTYSYITEVFNVTDTLDPFCN